MDVTLKKLIHVVTDFQHFIVKCSAKLIYFTRNGKMIRHFFIIKCDVRKRFVVPVLVFVFLLIIQKEEVMGSYLRGVTRMRI